VPHPAPPGVSTETFIDVMALGFVGGFKGRRPRVLIPPNVPHPAEQFPLKILLIITSRFNGGRYIPLLVPALPPTPGRREEAQDHAPMQGRTQVQSLEARSRGHRRSDTRPLTTAAGVHTGQIAHA
jgi:hypothetical protein